MNETFDFSTFKPVKTKNYYQFDVSGKGHKSQQDRAYHLTSKFGCFPNARAITKRKIAVSETHYRDLTLNECERLQTLPDNYTYLDKGFSLNKSLSAIGNGWTVDVISNLVNNLNKEKEMNVLSLFDGISCGQVALKRAGVNVTSYHASEIDKYAMTITQANHPDTIQLGDMTKWREWDIDFSKIDVLFAGFPCQAWSIAGNQGGDNDPRGALVHDLLDIWKEIKKQNPNLKFLFENVKMKKEFTNYLNDLFGCDAILINSALFSAQNRQRLYWTNIEQGELPEDKGIVLKDILESVITDRDKSYCLDANYYKGTNFNQYITKSRRQIVFDYIEKERSDKILKLASMSAIDRKYHVKNKIEPGEIELKVNKDDFVYTTHLGQNGKLTKAKCATLVCASTASCIGELEGSYRIRKLTPIEAERCQTLPDGYTDHVSNTQRYKAIGNGWTVDTVAYLVGGLK